MKMFLVPIAMIFIANASHAKTVCLINAGVKQGNFVVYDKSLYSQEVESHKIVVIGKDGDSAKEVNFEQMSKLEEWAAIDGQTVVAFAKSSSDGSYAISVGKVDMSKVETNILPLNAITSGYVTEKQPLYLNVPSKNLTALCLSMP